MAAIFPPADRGGIPPGPNTPDAYVPVNAVVGEGPLYVSNECSTVLTADQLNGLTSEILAAVDLLGFSYNSTRVDNLGQALVAKWNEAEGIFVNVSGDAMEGPLILARDPVDPMEAATKRYAVARAGDTMLGTLVLSGDPLHPLDAAPMQYVDAQVGQLRTDTDTALGIMQGDVNRRVLRTGDTMNGELDLQTGVDATNPDAAMRKEYINTEDQKRILRSGDTMTGILTLSADPVGPLDAATRQYVDTHATTGPVGGYVPVAGGTMTGPLILSGPPTVANGAATKIYVDNALTGAGFATVTYVDAQVASRVALSGATMTGPLILSADPVTPMAASSKQYTDSVGNAAKAYADNAAANAATTAANNRVLRSGDTMSGNLTLALNTPTVNFTGNDGSAGRTLHYRYNSLLTWYVNYTDVINHHAYDDGGGYQGSALNIYRPHTTSWTVETKGVKVTSGEGGFSQSSGALCIPNGGIGVGGNCWFNARINLADGMNIGSPYYFVGIDGPTGDLAFVANQAYWNGFNFTVVQGSGVALRAFHIGSDGTLNSQHYFSGALYVDGAGNFYVGSDERLKTVLGPFTRGLDALRKIGGADLFTLKSEEKRFPDYRHAGFIAQKVRRGIPEAVKEGHEGILSLDDRPIIAALMNAVIELADKVEELTRKVAHG